MAYVTKRDGRKEEFDRSKIIRTCLRAGASQEVAEKVVEEIKRRIYDGISTDKILKMVLELLKKHAYTRASRYDLKMALLRLGPAGYEFEKFVARLLREYGYSTETNVYVEGMCVTHEIDVIAEKNGERYMIECKFHNIPGIYTGLKEVMYTYARFLDVTDGYKNGKNDVEFSNAWIFTNTKFSWDAKRFGECKGMMLTGWRYPEGKSIENMLEKKNLYPITVLESVGEVKDALINASYIFCRDLLKADTKDLLKIADLRTIEKIRSEARDVLD